MAGMLPGVECARRRRIWSDSPPIVGQSLTRRSVLCLYTSNHDTLLLASNPSLQQRRLLIEGEVEDELDGIAREAKRRLDGRLRKSEDDGRERIRRKFNWRKFNWNGVEEEDKCGQCW